MLSSKYVLIENGTIVNDDAIFKADVLVEGEKIRAVGTNVLENLSVHQRKSIERVDASECLVIPGGIDPHTHMQLPFMGQVSVDDFYQGTRAALAGGTTMIIDFVIPSKTEMPLQAYKRWKEWAEPKVCCDYAFSMAITKWESEVAEQMELLTKPEYGINSFKFYLAYKDSLMVDDYEFFQGLKQCAKIGALARVHAENGNVIEIKQKELLNAGITGPEGHTQSRPEELEAEATNRACILANEAHCPLYVVHVMSKSAARVIARHRNRGQVIFGEPIAAGLALDGSGYYDKDWDKAAGLILSPPLSRKPDTPAALMDLLASNQLHLTGTDNCTFNCEQKRVGRNDFTKIPNGVNGVEDRLSIVWEKGVHSGKIDAMRFVAITSSVAAKIFNIYPQKGRIQVGSDADLVVWDPEAVKTISAKTHHQATDFNVFEGQKVHGIAKVTISRGKVVWKDGKLSTKAGAGQFVPLAPNCAYVFNAIRVAEKRYNPLKINRDETE